MADRDPGIVVSEAPAAPPPPRGRRIALWIAAALGVLLLLAAALFFGANTDFGRRILARELSKIETETGLKIGIGRLEGSIYGDLVIHDLTLSDPRGVFLRAPRVELDYEPLAYLRRSHVDIDELHAPFVRVLRTPELRPGDPNAPILPDIDIDVDDLRIDRLLLEPPVTGRRHLLSLQGEAHIADRRAQVRAAAVALVGPGIAGGDRLQLTLDAVPDNDRFDVDARLAAPVGGLVSQLSGVNQPIVAEIKGQGGWRNWRGSARALLGGQPFANLQLANRDGTFTVRGPVKPDLLVPETYRRLLQPVLAVDLTTTLAERRADTSLRLRSDAFDVAANGIVDLGESRYGNLRINARLLQPGAIAPNLRGQDVQAAFVLDGPFATPTVGYDVRATALGFGATTLQNVRATGQARVQEDRIVLPVALRAARVLGLPAAAGELLTNVRVDGSLLISGPKILSENLRLRSDRLNATLVVAADVARGQYRGAFNGRVEDYAVRGVGLVDVTTDLNIVQQGAGYAITGRFAAQTKRLENAGVRDFLGGNALVRGDIAIAPNGVIGVANVRLAAPLVTVTNGRGRYDPASGALAFTGSAVTREYGAVQVAVSGTIAQPNLRLRARNPNFGVGLRDIDADVRAVAGGYFVRATGQSDYGPFSADLAVIQGAQLAFDIRRLTFAEINFAGRIVRTAAGPFAGSLTANGRGLDGTIQLAAQGRYQRATVRARANGATIPGPEPILIARGLIDATVVLFPGRPAIVGQAQLAGVRRGALLVDALRARADYQAGVGTIQAVANGRSGVPFRVALNSRLTPDFVRAAAQGQVGELPFRLANPATLRRTGGDWVLDPATLVLPQGNVRLAGRFGRTTLLQTRFDGLDLRIANAFVPDTGFSGRASGSVDFQQTGADAFPRADARLTIVDFARATVTGASMPVNVALAGALRPDGGAFNAVIRRNGGLIGRAQVRLQPVGGRGSWTERLLAAPLAGGIRYNGPADVLWSFTGIADQQLSGPIGVAADFSGRVNQPQLSGIVRANALAYENAEFGTRVSSIQLQGRFDRSTFELTRLAGRAGRGTVTGSGRVGLAAASGFPIDIGLRFAEAQLARSDQIGATVSGDLRVVNSAAAGASIRGDLTLPQARYRVQRAAAAQVVELTGIRRAGAAYPPVAVRSAATPSQWDLDIAVRADNQIYVSGLGLDSEWQADLRVRGTSATPEVTGEAEVLRGTFSFAGRRLELDEGRILFRGQRPINPTIDISASTTVEGITARINVEGNARTPRIAFSSTPALPQDEVLARLFFGGSVSQISAAQAVQLAASLNALRAGGGGGGGGPLGKLRGTAGLDRLRILGADRATGRGTAIAAGTYVSNDIYVEVITDTRGFTATQIEIALSRALSLLSQVGSSAGTGVNLRYSKDY
ncbi:MAG: Inner membrane component of TAM transport system [uncultured Sphingomonadaceae bacterium]|uniref:Inner membrane component of TAM transport system n=1 Tax=uncultured Sphingomonadaceae bacterium TaxID=169976 RepID=A0A6J4SET0_9SPHN|nr:MAG: Inner membrane component of TAM transport system [uncultured Sphingomonadaceae bacterium]